MVSFDSGDLMNPERFSGSVRPPRHRAARLPLAVAAVALAVFAARIVENRLSARTALAEGEDAFRRGDFRHAAAKFKFALDLDPASTTVRLRLVAAYHKQYVPGGESRANLEVATQTLDEIARVLERDPSNRAAIVAAAEIEDGRSDYDQARDWYRRLMAIDSSSATAFAGLSAASLKQVSGAVLDAEARAGLLPAAFALRASAPKAVFALRASAPKASGRPIAKDDMRKSLAERWSATIAEGIDAGTRAVVIDRENDGVMLTLSAWHELAADLAASPDEYQQHMTRANDWRHRAHEARRQRAERGPR
jgi:tetratricopeptide (TPR) repeat protein